MHPIAPDPAAISARIDHARASAHRRTAFIPFLCAGDPDLDTTAKALIKLDEIGADVIELGVPFSDPMADGPAIQAAALR